MVMKANFLLFKRLFKKQIIRFLTILAIVLVSIGFMAGVGEVEPKIKYAINNYYQTQNVSDLNIKSTNISGFSYTEIEYLNNKFGNQNILKSFSTELKDQNNIIRLYMFDFSNLNINKLEILEGLLPKNNNEVVVERQTTSLKSYKIGDSIQIMGNSYVVTGIVKNPLFINKAEESSYNYPNESISQIVYLNTSTLPIINDIYISFENKNIFNSLSQEYEDIINNYKDAIKINLGENVVVLSLFENLGIRMSLSYAEKVGDISLIFVVFFILVTLLVVYSTMSRLLDEERSQTGCLVTLGYKNYKAVNRYIYFVFVATIMGGVLAFGVSYGVTRLLYYAFNIVYSLPKFPSNIDFSYYLIVFLTLSLSIIITTLLSCYNLVKNKPIVLLSRKAPKVGKKTFLELFPFIWNRFSFKYKSTLRNVFLFKSRFFMTIISIAGSTVLVLAGLGLLDNALKMENSSAIIAISIVLIVFSAFLSELVIYNLTNINISERNREIATLMVLGYKDREVSGYIYREIYILTLIGAVIGMPIGYGFLVFLFNYIDFGKIADINWWSWLLTPIIIIFFTFISTIMLYRKIIKIDMNSSLKSVD